MEALLVYGLKSGALMSAFFAAYFLLLRDETFFKTNRWYLLAGLLTSALLPLLTIKKIHWTDPRPAAYAYDHLPADLSSAVSAPQNQLFEINWLLVLILVYSIGASLFLIRFIADCCSIYSILKNKNIKREFNFKMLDTTENISPFSFFNFIVYNSSLYSKSELKDILEHEKVHCREVHTADVLLSRLFCIIFWWNPFVWLHKKAILQNLEFIADSEAAKILDKKSYQFTLLKITTHEHCVSISNHFYQSLIKKRIVMLNKNQSKKWNSWKYAVIVPALVAFVFYFQVKVIAQERNVPPTEIQQRPEAEVIVDKDATDFFLSSESKRLKDEHGITLKFSSVKRNEASEIIAIKTTYKDKEGNKGTSAQSGTEPIAPFRFHINRDEDGRTTAGIGNVGNLKAKVRQWATQVPEVPSLPNHRNIPDVPELPETPPAPARTNGRTSTQNITTADGEQVVVTTLIDEKGNSIISVNGEVVADINTDVILAGMEPVFINGIDVLRTGKPGGANAIRIDTDEISREAMEEVRREIEKVRPALEKARTEVALNRPEMEKARREMMKARKEMSTDLRKNFPQDRPISKQDYEQTRRELEQAKRDMEQAKRDIEQSKRDIEQSRRELEQYKRERESKK